MAKKPDKKKPSKEKADKNWMERFATPSRRDFMRYVQGQQTQYDPIIARLQMQIAGSAPEKDPVVQAYERMAAGLPTEQAISQAYRGGLENVANLMRGVNVARGGEGVQAAVQAVGEAIGAEPGTTADIARQAGAVSGVGGGQDVISQALLESAGARFAGLETERLGQVAGQRQEFALGAGQARLSAKERQRELSRAMAEARGKQRAGRINPFDIAGMIMSFQAAQRAGRGGAGGVGGTVAGDEGGGGGDPDEARYREQIIKSGLQGLIMPQIMRPNAPNTITESGAMVGSAYQPSTIVQGPMAGTGYRAPVGAVQGATRPAGPTNPYTPAPRPTNPYTKKRPKNPYAKK